MRIVFVQAELKNNLLRVRRRCTGAMRFIIDYYGTINQRCRR